MTVLDIALYPTAILKKVAKPIVEFDSKLSTLVDDMLKTMYSANGVGLAAPQVHVSQRVVVIDVSEERDQPFELINPEILSREGKQKYEEGCLSIPGFRNFVERADKIHVLAFDRKGKSFELEADGLLSVCIQHEVDHLDGILFIDRLSRLKVKVFDRWFEKVVANGEYPSQNNL